MVEGIGPDAVRGMQDKRVGCTQVDCFVDREPDSIADMEPGPIADMELGSVADMDLGSVVDT
jgi:hypothetical protein